MVVGSPYAGEDEKRFSREASDLKKKLFLLRPSIQEKDFQEFLGSSEEVFDELQLALLEWQNEDICLIYIGHGQENGWALSGYRDIEVLDYELLKIILALHHGNLIFLNACCDGLLGKMILVFHNQHLFFGYSQDNPDCSLQSFWNKIVNAWEQCKLADCGFELNGQTIKLWDGDEKLNALMYPVKTKSPV